MHVLHPVHEGGRLTDRQAQRPTGVRADRIAELSALVSRLTRVVDADYIPVWMTKPAEALDDEKPIDVLARGGVRASGSCGARPRAPGRGVALALAVEAARIRGEWLKHAAAGLPPPSAATNLGCSRAARGNDHVT